jgi:hypothetical protein
MKCYLYQHPPLYLLSLDYSVSYLDLLHNTYVRICVVKWNKENRCKIHVQKVLVGWTKIHIEIVAARRYEERDSGPLEEIVRGTASGTRSIISTMVDLRHYFL